MVPAGQRDRMGEAFRQQRTIGQAGEKIVLCQMGHLLRHRPRLTDIVEHDHCACDIAAAIVDRCGGIFDGGLESVAANQHGVDGQAHGTVLRERMLRRIRGALACRGVDDR